MKTVIKAEKLKESLAVLESSRQFDSSLFNLVYNKAALLINQLIRSQIYPSDSQKHMMVRNTIENIVSFQGRRGTGKTSAMLSVREEMKQRGKGSRWWRALEHIGGEKREEKYGYDEAYEYEERYAKKYNSKCSFVVIDYIDASMLERGEDILELILANMFSLLQEKDKEEKKEKIRYENRELYADFANIFGILTNVKKHSGANSEMSSLQKLAQLSNSQILGSKIERLVKNYLKYMLEDEKAYAMGASFLVIAIDDIDMHFQKEGGSPYELLETLHRYLMIPNVIILVSYDYTNLCRGCEKHFFEIYHEKLMMQEEDIKFIRELSNAYLNKILPNYTRIHMPSLRKRDYEEADEKGYSLQIEKKDIQEVFGDFANNLEKGVNENELLLPVKQFAFLLKASTAGLFYDALGSKRHFSDPTSLRELAQLYVFYEHLRTIKKQHKDEIEKNNAVYKELLDDLYFRYAMEKLDREDFGKFKNYLDVKIERRSRNIINDIRKERSEKEKRDVSTIRYVGKQEYSYSMGELLYTLYQASSEGLFTKELVSCILDSYTIMLTKLYRNYVAQLKKGEKKAAKEDKNRLLEVMGASISSSWSNLLMPRYRKEMGKWVGMDSSEQEDSKIVDFAAVKFTSVEVDWSFEIFSDSEWISERNEKSAEMLRMQEILCMFFTNVHNRNREESTAGFIIDYKPNEGKKSISDPLLRKENDFRFRCTDGCFNVMNFVNNLFLGSDYFDKLHKDLEQAWIEYFEISKKFEGENFSESDKKSFVKKFFAENSIYTEKKDWWEKSAGLALPVYSFDMIYNLFKRCYLNQDVPYIIKFEGNFLPSILKLLIEKIGRMLEKEAEYYYKVKEDEPMPENQFYSYYEENPFLEYLKALEKDEVLNNIFEKRFRDIVGTITV